jgi:myo-inositol 2-dehydrogenase/D-chiro-inositol 1-dehydrogenase
MLHRVKAGDVELYQRRRGTHGHVLRADGVVGEKPLNFFLERYAEAYRLELAHFIEAIEKGTAPMVGGPDGVRALALADAALEALKTGRAVKL